MALTTFDGAVAALAAAQKALWAKSSATTAGAGTLFSLFGTGGTPPAGAKAGSKNGAIPDYTTAGALGIRNPASGNTLYAGTARGVGGAQAGLLMLYDRVWHDSEFDCTVTSAQAVTKPALTRSTDGIGLELWAEAWTAWGATGTTFTVSYTNTLGNAGRSATYVWPAGAPTVGQCFRFVLAGGDQGVTDIASLTLTPSTGTAGNLGLFLAKPICAIPFAASTPISASLIELSLATISNSACIAGIIGCTAGTTGVPIINLALPEG